jgi:uncharacterized protein DUF1840
MLVRFRSNAGDMTMFGDVALELIKMMGHSGTVPSAILARDIPPALERLKRAVAAAPPPLPPSDDAEREDGPRVSLQQRAFPLIELLERCAKNGWDLMWEQQR